MGQDTKGCLTDPKIEGKDWKERSTFGSLRDEFPSQITKETREKNVITKREREDWKEFEYGLGSFECIC